MDTVSSSILFFLIIILMGSSIVITWFHLPGTFIFLFFIFLCSFLNNFEKLGLEILIISFIGFVLLEILEFLLSILSVKFYGGKSTSSFISILGGFVCAFFMNFFLPIIGACIGFVVGSYFSVYFNEKKTGKTKEDAMKIAKGTIIGYMISKGLKTSGILLFGFYLLGLIN